MSSTIIKPVFFVVAVIVAFGASVGSAQETGRVAILDVAKVFKENSTFITGPAAIFNTGPANADQLKAQIMAEQNRIKAEAEKLRKFEWLCREARTYFNACWER